jgi:ABC-type dipeptide/oligopeptide/nickel transport system ATPase component
VIYVEQMEVNKGEFLSISGPSGCGKSTSTEASSTRRNSRPSEQTDGIPASLREEQPVASVRPVDQIIHDSIARQRFTMVLLGIFASVALVLAAAGIYGVMAYSVTQRTHELGIRLALGAKPMDVLRLICELKPNVMLTTFTDLCEQHF